LINALVLVAHVLFELLQTLLGATIRIEFPLGICHDFVLIIGVDNLEMAHKAVGILEVGAHRSFGLLDVSRVRRRASDD
jgi:hypothetical protein